MSVYVNQAQGRLAEAIRKLMVLKDEETRLISELRRNENAQKSLADGLLRGLNNEEFAFLMDALRLEQQRASAVLHMVDRALYVAEE